MSTKGFRILLAEDDEDHVLLLRRALRHFPKELEIQVARDGQEALDLLRASLIPPELLLLDINMPKLSGIEVLRAVKADPGFTTIPTVMLTTSAREEDRAASLEGGADAFVTKPVNFRRFANTLHEILAKYCALADSGSDPLQ